MAVVVTVTQPAVTVTATSTSHAATLSAGDIAGIVIGCLLGGLLLVVIVFRLYRRYTHHSFTRVPNGPLSSPQVPSNFTSMGSRGAKHASHQSKKPSVSSEPLISPVSWPPIPLTSRVHSPGTPPRSDTVSPVIRESVGEINHATVSRSTAPAELSIPSARKPERTSPSPKSPQTLFVHRMLQSRARASDFDSPAHQSSLDSVPSPSSTLGSETIRVHEVRMLADAERTVLRDAEVAQKDEEDWEEISTTESLYSQLSAPPDDSLMLDPVSRRNSSHSVQRRKSSRRRPPSVELTPVTEAPDTPRIAESQSVTLSLAGNSSLDAQISHGTISRPMSMVLDESNTLPLLTSVNFGKDSTSATATGSISSTADWGSGSSGRASRYPSLATSSIGQFSQSGSRSDGDTDWRHTPPGLSGLKTLQAGPLRNPYSPVEERPEQTETLYTPSSVDAILDKRAHLRQGTASSVPEVERRTVMGSGIAHIDVAF